MFARHAAKSPGRSTRARVAVTAWLVLSGCAAGASGVAAEAAWYACGETRVRVRFLGERVILSLPDTVIRVPLARSASGARYADGQVTVWEHQGALRVELPDTTYPECARV